MKIHFFPQNKKCCFTSYKNYKVYFISFSVHVVVTIGKQLKGDHSHPKIKIKIINLNLEISNTCIMK